MPEVKVGIPSVVEAALLPGLIGWGRTRELLLFGENIDAATALAWGLVEQVVAPDALDAAVEARLASLLAAGPQAVRLQKKLIRQWEDMTLCQAVSAGIESFTQKLRDRRAGAHDGRVRKAAAGVAKRAVATWDDQAMRERTMGPAKGRKAAKAGEAGAARQEPLRAEAEAGAARRSPRASRSSTAGTRSRPRWPTRAARSARLPRPRTPCAGSPRKG